MSSVNNENRLNNLNQIKIFLEKALTCGICCNKMKNPRLLPCNKNKSCLSCFKNMLINDKKTCKFCKQKHEQEDEGNDFSILLKLSHFSVIFYNEIIGTLNKLNTNPALYIDSFFSEIILSIDIRSEKAIEYNIKNNTVNSPNHIENINKKRDIYLKMIKDFSEKCLLKLDRKKFEKNVANMSNKIKELDEKSLKWLETIKLSINDKDGLTQINNVLDDVKKFKVEYGKCVEQIERDLFLDKYCLFESSDTPTKEPYIGVLKEFNRFLYFHDLEIKNWINKSTTTRFSILSYDYLIEDITKTFPNDNFMEKLEKELRQTGLNDDIINIFLSNSKADNWPNYAKKKINKSTSARNDNIENLKEYQLCIFFKWDEYDDVRSYIYAVPVIRYLNLDLDSRKKEECNTHVGFVLWFLNVFFKS